MKVLIVSNYYRPAAGGAETVALQTQALLDRHGDEVVPFAIREPETFASAWQRYYPVGGELRTGRVPTPRAVASVYSIESRRRLGELLTVFAADVAHLHNVYDRLTLSVVDALAAARVPVVLTLHDYRTICPNTRLLTHDGICTRCVGGHFWQAVRHRCIGGRITPSALVAAEAYLTRARRHLDRIDVFVSPSRFLRDLVVDAGLPAGRIEIIPNAVEPASQPRSVPTAPPRFVFFGRFSPEKGVHVLLAAATLLERGVRIVVFGEGPLEPDIRKAVAQGLPIDLRGYATRQSIFAELATATSAVLPSQWYENCSMAILEAAGQGVATIATNLGGNPELVAHGESGLLVPPGDPASLAAAMNQLAADPDTAARLGHAAWRRTVARHSPQQYLSSLTDCYRRVVTSADSR